MKNYCQCEQPEKHEKYNFCTKCFHVIYHGNDRAFYLLMFIMGIIWFVALVVTDHR